MGCTELDLLNLQLSGFASLATPSINLRMIAYEAVADYFVEYFLLHVKHCILYTYLIILSCSVTRTILCPVLRDILMCVRK